MMKMSKRIGSDGRGDMSAGSQREPISIKRRRFTIFFSNSPMWNETETEQESYLSSSCEATLFRVQLMLQ